ncbi:MAG: AMP-binding protein [Thermoanaerobaculia bacterium]|nr:AMP-binding protein [Thermoanaerobaculia bacterium]
MLAKRVYDALPYPGRVIAATLRGFQLQRNRYDRTTPLLVREALQRDAWSADQWEDWRSQALARSLLLASKLPFYAEQGLGSSRLSEWPVVRKEDLRADTASFSASKQRGWIHEHTSGSTGTPLSLHWSRKASVLWYALVEARLRRWHGVSRHTRWAILGGQLVAPANQRRPPYWVWNAAARQLYLSSYHLAPDTVAAYLEAMRAHRVEYLLAYPSAAAALASFALDAGTEVAATAPGLKVVVTNAEPLSPAQRSKISTVFDCPTRDSYGLAELVAAASECEEGRLHLWPEVGFLEVLDDDDQPVEAGQPGRLVATGLLNDAMALVRYDTGDEITLAPPDERCACGRGLPLVRELRGRSDDVLETPDGRQVGRLDPVFKHDFPIHEAQIVQTALDRVVARVVPARGFDSRTKESIRRQIEERMGPLVRVEVEEVDELTRGPSGKLRAVVKQLDTPSQS